MEWNEPWKNERMEWNEPWKNERMEWNEPCLSQTRATNSGLKAAMHSLTI